MVVLFWIRVKLTLLFAVNLFEYLICRGLIYLNNILNITIIKIIIRPYAHIFNPCNALGDLQFWPIQQDRSPNALFTLNYCD